jgi:hypothetical protein
MTDSSLLSKVKPFAMSRALPRAFDYYVAAVYPAIGGTDFCPITSKISP